MLYTPPTLVVGTKIINYQCFLWMFYLQHKTVTHCDAATSNIQWTVYLYLYEKGHGAIMWYCTQSHALVHLVINKTFTYITATVSYTTSLVWNYLYICTGHHRYLRFPSWTRVRGYPLVLVRYYRSDSWSKTPDIMSWW